MKLTNNVFMTIMVATISLMASSCKDPDVIEIMQEKEIHLDLSPSQESSEDGNKTSSGNTLSDDGNNNGTVSQNKIPGTYSTFKANGVSFRMIDVKGGSFYMGSYDDAPKDPVHKVTLSSFQIAETEVTQELWTAVMGNNPSHFLGKSNLPVEHVSWKDCQKFIERLNEMTGEHFRLPTEAEWEYAARGGNKTKGYLYAGSNDLNSVGWYKDNSLDSYQIAHSGEYVNNRIGPHPVGTKQSNELGICDMSGNLIEYCQDYYGDYSSTDQKDPKGPSAPKDKIHPERVARGGAFINPASPHCKVTTRYGLTESGTSQQTGFRLAR